MNLFDMPFTKTPDIGRKVRSLMRQLDIKQDVLANALNVSQQQISKILQKDTIDPETLDKIATAMKIPVEAIENYNEDAVAQFIANTFTVNTHDNSNHAVYQHAPVFNYADKFVEFLTAELKAKDEQLNILIKEIAILREELAAIRAKK